MNNFTQFIFSHYLFQQLQMSQMFNMIFYSRKLQSFNKPTDVERNYMLFYEYISIITFGCTEQCVFLQMFFLMNIFQL